MDTLKVYDSLPPEVKLKMIEEKVAIMLEMISEINLLNKHANLMSGKSRENFDKNYQLLFHGSSDATTERKD